MVLIFVPCRFVPRLLEAEKLLVRKRDLTLAHL